MGNRRPVLLLTAWAASFRIFSYKKNQVGKKEKNISVEHQKARTLVDKPHGERFLSRKKKWELRRKM